MSFTRRQILGGLAGLVVVGVGAGGASRYWLGKMADAEAGHDAPGQRAFADAAHALQHDAGALAGVLVGAVTVVVWKQGGWLGLYEIVPGFVLGGLVTVIVSLCGKPSATMLENHKAVEVEMQSLLA